VKVTFEFYDPLQKDRKISKSVHVRGKGPKAYINNLLKLADDGLTIVPIDVIVEGEEVKTIFLSTMAQKYSGKINSRPAADIKIPTETIIQEQPKVSFWRKFFKNEE